MMISTRGRYALRVMLDLAQDESGSYVPLDDIARREGMSEKYLESIIAPLSRSGIVEAARGKGGGYRLAETPDHYSAYDILSLAESGLSTVSCLGKGGCDKADACRTLPLWQEVNVLLENYLRRVTLADLLQGAVPSALQ